MENTSEATKSDDEAIAVVSSVPPQIPQKTSADLVSMKNSILLEVIIF